MQKRAQPQSIVLNTFEVKALRSGRLLQLRRPAKVKPSQRRVSWYGAGSYNSDGDAIFTDNQVVRSPYGNVDNVLAVKESWCKAQTSGKDDEQYYYRADNVPTVAVCVDDGDGFTATNKDGSETSPWMSPSTMPMEAARIHIKVMSRWVERFEATPHSAVLEGFAFNAVPMDIAAYSGMSNHLCLNGTATGYVGDDGFRLYCETWNKRFGKCHGSCVDVDEVTHVVISNPATVENRPWTWVCRFMVV